MADGPGVDFQFAIRNTAAPNEGFDPNPSPSKACTANKIKRDVTTLIMPSLIADRRAICLGVWLFILTKEFVSYSFYSFN